MEFTEENESQLEPKAKEEFDNERQQRLNEMRIQLENRETEMLKNLKWKQVS